MFSVWYHSPKVLYKLARRLKGRELAFLGKPTVRVLKAHSSLFLAKHLKQFNIFDNRFNMYHSIAHLYDMPVCSYNFITRKAETNKFFLNYSSYVRNFDFVIDLDSTDPELVYKEMLVLHRLFKNMNIEHEVVFSGKKGFHIEVKNLPVDGSFDLVSTTKRFGKLALMIKDKFNISTLDECVYDQVRIWKCPYSIDSRTDLVVLPLTEWEINNFSKSLCDPKRVLPNVGSRPDFCLSPGLPQNLFKLEKKLLSMVIKDGR